MCPWGEDDCPFDVGGGIDKIAGGGGCESGGTTINFWVVAGVCSGRGPSSEREAAVCTWGEDGCTFDVGRGVGKIAGGGGRESGGTTTDFWVVASG